MGLLEIDVVIWVHDCVVRLYCQRSLKRASTTLPPNTYRESFTRIVEWSVRCGGKEDPVTWIQLRLAKENWSTMLPVPEGVSVNKMIYSQRHNDHNEKRKMS